MSTLYTAPSDHGPAIRLLFCYRTARQEWQDLLREEGFTPASPLWDNPCADTYQGAGAKEMPLAGRTCGHCLARFMPKSNSARFCCPGCRKAATALSEKARGAK